MRHQPTANDRFKARFGTTFWIGLMAATALHVAVFRASPSFAVTAGGDRAAPTVTVAPPVPPVPEPPPEIHPPVAPTIVVTDVDDPLPTIPPNMGDQAPGAALLPPPPSREAAGAGSPTWVPFDVAPRLLNPGEIQEMLQRRYPAMLRDAGIEGVVGVWLHVDTAGRVTEARLHEPSPYALFNDAALAVAADMRFSPASSMDRDVAVWVSMAIRFEVP